MADVIPWVSLIVAITSAVFTWLTYRDHSLSNRELHVSRVTLALRDNRKQVSEDVWNFEGREIIVRNDGTASVTVKTIAMAHGDQFVFDRSRPTYWQLDFVPSRSLPRRLLTPGTELLVEAPNDPTGTHVLGLGPVVTLTDTHGRVWQRTEWGWRQLHDRGGRPFRARDLWFERRSWWRSLDAVLLRRAMSKASRHPARLPWEVRLIDLLWGYRPGHGGVENLPWDAPQSWQYTDLHYQLQDKSPHS